MIWTKFLKSTCKPKKVQKKPTCKPIKPDHLPAKPAQPTRPPELINERLANGLSVSLFSTNGQWICPIPDPNPPLITSSCFYDLNLYLLEWCYKSPSKWVFIYNWTKARSEAALPSLRGEGAITSPRKKKKDSEHVWSKSILSLSRVIFLG